MDYAQTVCENGVATTIFFSIVGFGGKNSLISVLHLKNRLVKIFAEDEWGGHKPVCYFVQPLRAGRC